MSDEKRSKCGHRDHDNLTVLLPNVSYKRFPSAQELLTCNSSFGLEPEYRPRSVNLAVIDIPTSYPNYCGYHRKDTKTQNPPECKFSPQANLDMPEKDDRNGYNFYTVNHRPKVFRGTWILRKASVHTSKITLAFRIAFSRARAVGVTHLTAGDQQGFFETLIGWRGDKPKICSSK